MLETPRQPSGWQMVLVLTIGVLATSTAAILVRLAIAEAGISGVGFSLVLAASRLTLSALVLLPTWRAIGNHPPAARSVQYAVAAGVALAIHFATWITSLSYTSIAASTILVTTNPLWVAVLSWLWLGEKPLRRTLVGIGIALLGGMAIGLDSTSSSVGANPLLGNGLALVGAWAASVYFLLGREAQRQGLSVSGYVAMAYSTAAILLLPLPILFGARYTGYSWMTYLTIGLLALLPQLVGHTSLNWSVRWLSPTVVTLAILFEPVMSSFLGYVVFHEVPGFLSLTGALLLLVGIGVAATANR